jgi:ribosomal protein L16/L10AE
MRDHAHVTAWNIRHVRTSLEIEARKAMRLAAAKLPILTKFATRFAQEKML